MDYLLERPIFFHRISQLLEQQISFNPTFNDFFLVLDQTSSQARPGDGLYTNDYFCFTRWRTLGLKQPARPLGAERASSQQRITLSEKQAHPGGTDEASVDDSPANDDTQRRPTTLGPGISVPAELGRAGETSELVDPPHPAGGVRCE